MRRFTELHINSIQTEEMLKLASHLGYKTVGVTVSQTTNNQIKNIYKNLSVKYGLEIVGRVDLKPDSPLNLLQNLRKLRRKYEVIAVLCFSKQVARQAAKDRRVDLLNFPLQQLNLFDEAEAELASNSNVALEINFTPIAKLEKWILPKVFSRLRRCIVLAKKFGVPVVWSNGATDIYELKPPRDLASFIQLFGLSKKEALNSVSTIPSKIVERNKAKLSHDFVGVGVRLIKGATNRNG